MANLALLNVIASSEDSATNVIQGVNLNKITSVLTTATTAAFTFGDDGGAANTITFTVTGGTPASSADYIISNDAAGEKMKNVKRILDWMMGMVNASVNGGGPRNKVYGIDNEKGLTQETITAEAGLTFGGATTEPLVSITVA